MALNTVTLTWDLADLLQAGIRATLSLAPNAVLTDAANHVVIPEVQRSAQFVNGTGSLAGIIACDNGTILPSGWAYTLTVSVLGQGQLFKQTVQINFANGATQDLSSLIPLSPAPGLVGYLPLPSGTPQAGYVPVASGTGEASAWGPSGTGGSGYPASPVVSGTPSTGQVLTATSPTAANWQPPAGGGGGITPPAGDIGGTAGTPTVVSTHLSSALPIAQGGTGQASQAAAITALTGTQTAGRYLRSDGTNASLAAIQAGDVPTLNQNTTGTAAGLSAALAIGSGGTGQGTQQAAIDALAGAVTSGSYLRGNGTHVTLAAIQAADIPATAVTPASYTNTNLTVGADGRITAASNGSSGGSGVTPTAVKTANYTAVAGDFVPCDTTSGAFTVTLPTTPADKSQVAVKMVIQGGSNTLTVTCGGSDVFNKAGGPASGTLSLVNQGMLLQYKASGGIWYVVSDDLPLSQLDLRYAALAGGVFTGAVVMTPVTLTDAVTIAVNAALGNQFKVTLGGNRILGAPSNPVNGQIITVWFIQDGTGTRTITLALSPGTSGGYWYGTDLTSITLSTAAGTMDKATFQYDAANTRWDVTGFLRGF